MNMTMIEPLESRTLLAGVTLLAHGYDGNINGWVAKVADDITGRAGGAGDVSRFVMTVQKNSSNALSVTSFAAENGFASLTSNPTAEVIVKLDWSSVSDGSFSTGAVAAVVANYLLSSNVNGFNLTSLPIDLIGHSRGASLNTALAQDLGKAGVWVDQQTNLDPHPVDGVNDFFGANFGDQKMATFDNVAFSDTYWRTDGDPNNLDFDGEPVSGSHNLSLNNSVQQDFIGSAHSSVPSYYDGTINLTTSNGGDTPIQSDWYDDSADKPARDQTGFLYDHIVGGPRPADGLWTASSGTASRTPAGQTGSQWANVSDVRVLGKRTFAVGESMGVRFIRQDRDSLDTVELLIDRDTNPFDNNFVRTMRRVNVAETDVITPARQNGATQGAGPGRYWVCARITDAAGHVRFAYSASFQISASAPPALPQSQHVSDVRSSSDQSLAAELLD